MAPAMEEAGAAWEQGLRVGRAQARRAGLGRDEAEDCAIEFALRLFARRGENGGGGVTLLPPLWLHRSARNFAYNWRRGLLRRQWHEGVPLDEVEAGMSSSAEAAQEALDPHRLVLARAPGLLEAALLQLSTRQRELLVRHHIPGRELGIHRLFFRADSCGGWAGAVAGAGGGSGHS